MVFLHIRKAILEDFDKIYSIYMDKTINPYMTFPIIPKLEFLEIFRNLQGGLLVYEEDNNIFAVYFCDKV